MITDLTCRIDPSATKTPIRADGPAASSHPAEFARVWGESQRFAASIGTSEKTEFRLPQGVLVFDASHPLPNWLQAWHFIRGETPMTQSLISDMPFRLIPRRAFAVIYGLTFPLLAMLFRQRILIRWLFGVRVPKNLTVHYDATTLLLKHAIDRVLTPEDRLALEVGIGQAALLSLRLQRNTNMVIEGLDCSASRVRSSRKMAKFNGRKEQLGTA